jgi:hypothetical protein
LTDADLAADAALPVAPADGGEQVDIYKPKPVHNWREFLNEISVIVIGVLIALAGELPGGLASRCKWDGR